MPKQGEIDYLKNIGPAAVRHAVGLPFSDPHCPRFLVELGTLMAQLPPPPARILDLGCGTGWTSLFLARRGYNVLGIDIAPDMIYHAAHQRDLAGLDNLQFNVCDYEDMTFRAEFDGVAFFGSLHHAVDEAAALRGAWHALKPGGLCVTCEPGAGHRGTPGAIEAIQRYGVTEKDMPPGRILELAQRVGFRGGRIVPHPLDLSEAVTGCGGLTRLYRLVRILASVSRRSGLVVLRK